MTYPVQTITPRPVSELQNLQNWRSDQWLAADSTAMCIDNSGRIIMVCGDTFSSRVPNSDNSVKLDRFTNNSLVTFHNSNFGVQYGSGINPVWNAPNPFFPSYFASSGVGAFRWPQGAWLDTPTRNNVHIMMTGYAGSIFTSYTPDSLYEYELFDNLTIRSSTLVPGLQPTQVNGEWVYWGSAMWVAEPWLYIFGNWQRTGDGFRLVVSRRNAYLGSLPGNVPQFWTGSFWSSDMVNIGELGPTPGNSGGVVPHPAGGLLFTSCRKGLLTNKIAAWHSATPNGTWTDLGDIVTVPSEFSSQFNYGGIPLIQGNKLFLMYNLNGSVAQLEADYRRYGIRWIETSIPTI